MLKEKGAKWNKGAKKQKKQLMMSREKKRVRKSSTRKKQQKNVQCSQYENRQSVRAKLSELQMLSFLKNKNKIFTTK